MELLKRKIEGVNPKRVEEGTIGFIAEDKWYNVTGETESLKIILEKIVAKGNVVEFEYNNGVVGNITLLEKAPETEKNWHDDMTNFEDLLNDAHEKFKGNFNIKTELVEMNYEKKQALFSACVSVENWEKNEDNLLERRTTLFTAHGDAEGITSDSIKPHFIRMAETRAIARALRWATNNAKVAAEETSGVPKA